MGFISDLKELSAWIIGISSLVILYVFIYIRLKREKAKS